MEESSKSLRALIQASIGPLPLPLTSTSLPLKRTFKLRVSERSLSAELSELILWPIYFRLDPTST